MQEAAAGGWRLDEKPVGEKSEGSFLRAFWSRLTEGAGGRSAAGWMLADFVVIQCAAIICLFGRLLWMLHSDPNSAGSQLAGVAGFYVGTMFPFSALFPPIMLLSRCYSGSRIHDWRSGASGMLGACAVAGAVLALACSFRGTLDALTAGTVMGLVALSSSGTLGARWLKVWVDSPHTSESVPLHARAVSREQAPVLVIGGAGYIGSILVRRLIAAGRKVRVLDSFVYGNAALRGLFGHPNMEFLSGDSRNIKSVVSAVEGVDTIIHLAAIVGDPACEQDRQTALETNYAATRMLIEVAKGAKVGRLLFASTCSVYGASDELMHEASPVTPISLYAQTKVQSERALLEAATAQFQPIILRLATVFGYSYRPRFDLVVNILTAKAHQEGVITIYNGQQWRPFIHVRDVAEGMLMVMDTPISVVGGQVFNLGDSSMNYTLEQVAGKIREIYPDTKVEFVDNNDRRNYRVSFDKIERLVGFRSSVDLEHGIQELRDAFERRQIEDYKLARYSNQCFLQMNGGARQSNEVDTYVMAAFSRHFQTLAQNGGS